MNDEEDITAYFLQVDKVDNCLKVLGENVKENMIVQKVLRSLPYHFDAKCLCHRITIIFGFSDELHGIIKR